MGEVLEGAGMISMHAATLTTGTRFCALRAPIDASAFRETWNVEPHDHHGLLVEYAESTATDVGALQVAARRQDRREILRAAHRIAGASHIVGALRMVAMCRLIEAAARDNNWAAMPGLVDALSGEADSIDTYVNSFERT